MRQPALVLFALFAGTAFAQSPTQPPTLEQLNQMFFAEYDADQDGKVTWEEFAADPAAKFRYLDRNADGVVDMQEVAAFTKMMTGQPPAGSAPQR